jgi:TPP-dependent pyruvate/acetoin dehydrogenase alpha subunit
MPSSIATRRRSRRGGHKEPIVRFKGWLEANQMIHPDDLARIESEVAAEIAAAVTFAEDGAWEPVEQLTRFTYADKAARGNEA